MPVKSSITTKMCHMPAYKTTSTFWLWNHLHVELHSLICSCNLFYSLHRNPDENMMLPCVNLIPLLGWTIEFPIQEHDISYCLFSDVLCIVISTSIDTKNNQCTCRRVLYSTIVMYTIVPMIWMLQVLLV